MSDKRLDNPTAHTSIDGPDLDELARRDVGVYAALVCRDNNGRPIEADEGSVHELFVEIINGLDGGVVGARLAKCAARFGVDLSVGQELERVNIVCPPGIGKSTWFSVIGVSWLLGRDPSRRIGLVSKSSSLAEEFSVAARNTMRGDIYRRIFPDARPDEAKSWAAKKWYLERHSADITTPSVSAGGVGGQIVGRRWDILIMDDVADGQTSKSVIQRQKLSTWVRQQAFSRVPAGGRIVNIGHRWHTLDWYGELEAEGWVTIRLPAIRAKSGAPGSVQDLLDRGEELVTVAPCIFSVEQELSRRSTMTPPIYEATCQQNPIQLSEGKYIRRALLRFDAIDFWHAGALDPNFGVEHPLVVGIAVDAAMSKRDQDVADDDRKIAYTVMVEGYREGGELHVPGLFRERCGFRSQIDALMGAIRRHRAAGRAVIVGLEDRAGGRQLHEMVVEEIQKDKDLAFDEMIVLELKNPLTDKVERAVPLIRRIEDRRLRLGAAYQEHEDELVSFPSGLNDIVDALAWLERLDLNRRFVEPEPEPELSAEEYRDRYRRLPPEPESNEIVKAWEKATAA